VAGVAAVNVHNRHFGIMTVADLSTGGAQLIGEALLAPGQAVEGTIQLPGRPPLAFRGTVLRRQASGPGGRRCGIRFDAIGGEGGVALSEDWLEPVALPAGAKTLVVWNRPAGRSTLERDLTAMAIPPLFASTPLEAAAWLRAGRKQLETVLVDYLVAGSDGWDFLQHLREVHPQMLRILLVDGIGNFRLNLLLSSGLADAILEKPWTAAALAKRLRPRGR